MGIRKYKPTTPGRRGSSVADFVEVTRSTPEKSLVLPLAEEGWPQQLGQDHHAPPGWRSQACLPRHRLPSRDKDGVPGKVAEIEYDPNRTARIALLHYADGEKRYILAPTGLKSGATVIGPASGRASSSATPCRSRDIPLGTPVHNIEMKPGRGGQDRALRRAVGAARGQGRRLRPAASCPPVRSATSTCVAAQRSARWATPSSRTSTGARPAVCAGRASRPTVRGVAMNPVDHPHGGGEGKTSGGRHPVNPNGKPEGRTRKANKAE